MPKFMLRERSGNHVEGPSTLNGKHGQYYVQGGQVFPSDKDRAAQFPDKFVLVEETRKITATFMEVPADTVDGKPGIAPSLSNIPGPEITSKQPPPSDPGVTKNALETIDAMTMDELKQFNQDEELGLDFRKFKSVDDARKAVKSAVSTSE